MTITKFIADDAHCNRTIIGDEESWDIKTTKGYFVTENAVYISVEKYKELKDVYTSHLNNIDSHLTDLYVKDFIEEAKEEEFDDIGGYVVFFISDKDKYYLKHTGLVKKIKKD